MLAKKFYFAALTVALAIAITLSLLPTPPSPVNTDGDSRSAKRSSPEPKLNALLIKNVDIFDGIKLIKNQNIEIREGVIHKIANELSLDYTNTIDAKGKTAIPGLIDAHTHSFGNALTNSLNFGVSTHIDMFTPPSSLPAEIKNRTNGSQANQTDLFSSGMLATIAGGHGTQFGIEVETIASASEADAWVANRLAEGSDFIKLVYMPYSDYFKSIDRATASAIIKAGHEKNLMVVAHISSQRAARELLEEGIDGFVHIFSDEQVDAEFVELAKLKNIFIIPTLSVIAAAAHEPFAQRLADDPLIQKHLGSGQQQQLDLAFGNHKMPGFDLSIALNNTRKLHQAGVTILAGSDAANPGTTYGASLHQELELLNMAGLTHTQALQAATINTAKAFKLGDRGRISVGQKADLLLLNASPLENILATRGITSIFKNGQIVQRQNPAKPLETSKISSSILSNFSAGMATPANFNWSKTDDSIANGKSVVNVEVTDQALFITASVNPGFMFPWAGAGTFSEQAVNISKYTQLQFRVRGSKGQYQTMMFSGSVAGAPPSQTITVTEAWQTVSLELRQFRGLDLTRVTGLAIVAGPTTGEYTYQLDDVKLVE
jgi:imidazolonepropionase-like amidohydrolase